MILQFAKDSSLMELELKNKFSKQLEAFLNYLKALPRIHIATLGPQGTSSEATGVYLLSLLNRKDALCSVYPSYEAAMEGVRLGTSDLLLIANAYSKIDKVYMCSELNLLLAFEHQTPVYGLAKKISYQLPENRPLKIATHHAPSSLIPQFINGSELDYEVILVESTSKAALITQQEDTDMCVTNSNSVQAYGLEFISATRPIRMMWSVFGRV
jgi:bacilysin biosynthesis protein BacA